jgi:hypothetical protein
LGAKFAANEKTSASVEAGHALKRAYAAQFRVVARGIEDMWKCREKLPPFATGPGTRVAFTDLKSLGAVLTVEQLQAVVEASDQLDRLFPPTYSAPRASTDAAYRAWSEPALEGRVMTANEKMGSALAALGVGNPHTKPCYGKVRKARLAAARRHQ